MNGCYAVSNIKSIQFNNSINTSKVNKMDYMFTQAEAISIEHNGYSAKKINNLDLSSFDIANTKDMHYMFKNAQATIGYARTQADANKFNNTSNKPSGLTFTVK